jgi:hypothetical protein
MMRQHGITMPQMQDGGMVIKMCVSKEMAERDTPPSMSRNESGCTTKNFQRSGGSYSVDMVCDGPHMKGVGTIKGTFSGNTSFTSTYDFKGTAGGSPINNHSENSGTWLAADCGGVKPYPLSK